MSRNDSGTPSTDKPLDTLCQLVLDALSPELNQTLLQVDDFLFDKAENASSDLEQTLYFDTMRSIRRNRVNITQAFQDKVAESFHNISSQTTTEPYKADDYEDALQIANLSNNVENQCHEQLFGIEKRLAILNQGLPLTEECNPLHPKRFVEAFALSISPYNVHNRIKTDLYRLFKQQVMEKSGEVYQSANSLMIEANILPNLRTSSELAQQTVLQTSLQTADAETEIELKPEPKAEAEHEPKEASLEKNTQTASPAQAPASSYEPKLSPSEILAHFCQQAPKTTDKCRVYGDTMIISALSHLQELALEERFHPFRSEKGAKEFKKMIRAVLEEKSEEPRILTAQDHGALNFTGHIFERIFHDSQLPKQYQGLFSKVSLPWARMALDEQSPLESDKHPALGLINEMAKAAEQFQDCPMFSRELYKQCQIIVEALIQEPQLRNYRLRELLDSLQQHITTLQHKANVIEQRSIEAGRGQETLLEARVWAERLIKDSSRSIPLPKFTERFLHTIWVDALAFHYLCYPTPDDKELCLELTGRMIDLVTMQNCTPDDFDPFAEKTIDFLMMQDCFPKPALKELLIELSKDAYGDEPNLTLLDQFNQQVLHPEDAQISADSFIPPASDAIINKLRSGVWCRATNEKGEPRRWKLAWQSPKGCLFLFVNGTGQKTALVDRGTLADWLMQGKLIFQPKDLPPLLTRVFGEIEREIMETNNG